LSAPASPLQPRQATRIARLAVTAAAFLCLAAGCRLGPDYQRPPVETPADWRWKTAEPRDQAPRGLWWQVFADPTLDDLESRAAAGNLDLKAAVARVDQARAAARMSAADLFPSLQGSASYARYRTSGNSPSPVPFPVPSFLQNSWQTPLDLTYEIDLWGKVRRSFESARALAFAAEAARQSVLLILQADVAAAYFQWRAAGREIDLLRRAIAIRDEALGLIRQRVEVGLSAEFEFERARVEVESARASLAATEQRQAETYNALAILCGSSPAQFEFAPPAADTPGHLPAIAPDIPASVLERRPDVAESERALAARNAQIGVARTAFFPSLRLTAQGGFLSGEVEDLFKWESRVWALNPSINFPIFQGGRNKANLARARAAYEEGVALYRQKILQAFREVEDNLAALAFLRERVRARTAAAAAASQAARLAYDRYKAGAVNFLETVDAEQARLQNETARVLAETEQRLATIRLIKALGGGWEQP
jgi:multidrug efflux system outer membrane protein